MILPIVAYGHPVLKRKASIIEKEDKELVELIENMFETMYNADGVGLAAPQIDKSVRLFIVDTVQLEDPKKEPSLKGIKQTFINPIILEENGEEWKYEEGCLSIPDVRGDVLRQPNVTIEYYDVSFTKHIQEFDGINARVIQHEYDHIEGILFTDRLKPLKKRLVRNKLEKISKGQIKQRYKMKFYKR